MTKVELIQTTADKTGLSQKDAAGAVNAVLQAITETLAKGEAVQLTGFGAFGVRCRPARIGTNPRTGEKVLIPAGKSPAFKAGKRLKAAVTADAE